jgi:beta-glucanase (GH16 family)
LTRTRDTSSGSHRRRGFHTETLEPRLLLTGTLAFSDDFNQAAGTLPNPNTWKYDTGWENGAYYVDDSTTMSIVNDPTAQDGKALALTTFPNTTTDPGTYWGARINTSIAPIGGALTYGHIEARIRLPGGPNGAGDGVGCSFWMLGSNFPTVGWPACGEIDIMENSGENPGTNGGTIHGPGFQQPGIYANYYLPTGQAYYQAYHTFAIDWSPGVVQFSVDGHVYAVRTRAQLPSGDTWAFDHPFFIILGIGRDGGSVDSNTVYPQTEYIDYVHAYSRTVVGVPSLLTAKAVSTNQINLFWQDTFNDQTGFTLQRSKTASFTTIDSSITIAPNVGSYQDTGLSANTNYFYRIQATSFDSTTSITTTSAFSYLTSATTWADQNINSTGGSAAFTTDTLTLIGGGSGGIGGTADQFNFADQSCIVDGSWTAEITSLTNTNAAAEAGVMLRTSSSSSSLFAGMFITAANTAVFEWRSGTTAQSASASITALPAWVKLVRAGTSFSGYFSKDGDTWTQVGSTQTIALATSALGGAAVTSHASSTTTAVMPDVSFSPTPVTPVAQINSGGSASGTFTADAGNTGGSTSNGSATIDTAGTNNPAPLAVYQSNRYGSFSYTFTGLTAGQPYDVQLLFAETYWTAVGSRIFDVIVNGDMALANFDIFAEAGAADRAVSKDIITTATSSGQIVLQFNTDKDNAQVNGIRILPEPGWLTVASGQTMTLSSSTSAPGITINDGATLKLTAGTHQTLSVGTVDLIGSGTLDLNDNAMIVRAGNLTNVTSEIASGYNGGPGIISTTAVTNPNALTTLGVIQNSTTSGIPVYTTFAGQTAVVSDVLVKYTYYGDANLSGNVDGTDYSLIDQGFNSAGAMTGWVYGDFNYDQKTDGSDYALIDNAFNQQTTPLALPANETAARETKNSEPAAPIAAAASLTDADDADQRKRYRHHRLELAVAKP